MSKRVKIYDETSRLKDLVVWGEPGCETVLGQLLPNNESLFWKKFDVVAARKEFKNMQSIFEANGIHVIRMKDVVAGKLRVSTKHPKTWQELSEQIKARGKQIYKRYNNPKRSLRGNKYEGDLKILDCVDDLIYEDVSYFGETKAIAINWTLCLSNNFPLANIMYARDQSNVLGNQIVLSRMKRDIRQPEVKLFRLGYKELGYANKLIGLKHGNFEGGDAYFFKNYCLIGVDVRTNKKGVSEIYNNIKVCLGKKHIKLFAVTHDGKGRKSGDEMEAMHLDTFMMPLDRNTILACCEEVDKRRVEEVISVGKNIRFVDKGTLRDFLEKTNKVHIINTSKKEQLCYSTNFLHLGQNKVVVPLEDKNHLRVNNIMRDLGFKVIVAGIKELVGGYGAVHCMTVAINRE